MEQQFLFNVYAHPAPDYEGVCLSGPRALPAPRQDPVTCTLSNMGVAQNKMLMLIPESLCTSPTTCLQALRRTVYSGGTSSRTGYR